MSLLIYIIYGVKWNISSWLLLVRFPLCAPIICLIPLKVIPRESCHPKLDVILCGNCVTINQSHHGYFLVQYAVFGNYRVNWLEAWCRGLNQQIYLIVAVLAINIDNYNSFRFFLNINSSALCTCSTMRELESAHKIYFPIEFRMFFYLCIILWEL